MRTAKACGPDAPRLASSWRVRNRWRWWHSMATREITYKPSSHCAGKAGLLPLNLYAHVHQSMHFFAHETSGAARTRSSPRPLLRVARALYSKRRERNLELGQAMSRERDGVACRVGKAKRAHHAGTCGRWWARRKS